MGLELEYNKGQTPIEEEELEELIIKTISTRGELDEFEQANIEKAVEWSLKRKYSCETILTIDFIQTVHKQMFSEVWGWAGKFRTSNKNLGVDWYQISTELKNLMDDCMFWIKNDVYSKDETAIHFSHRLVSIHPFPNGNGRHSRLCADILISHGLKKEIFSWGMINLVDAGTSREQYLSALRMADKGDIQPLLEFSRS